MTLRRRIDNFLWRFVTSRAVYVFTIIVVGLCIPLTVAEALPSAQDPWVWIYMVVVLVCGTVCLIVAQSRERWLEWSGAVSRGRYRRTYPTETRTR